jgi:outer membrane protein OmpA-like peptidoglycan-associated protein
MMEAIPAYFVIYFDFDSSNLSADARSIIREAANAAKKMRPSKILIYGHADRSGSVAYNQRLAGERARAVTKALINEGGGRFVIDVEEFGETRNAAKTTDNVKDGRNRRVEITLEK